jgi:hypothetical protein
MRMAVFFFFSLFLLLTDRYTYMEFLFWVAYGKGRHSVKQNILMSSRSHFLTLAYISSRIYLPLSNLLFVFS